MGADICGRGEGGMIELIAVSKFRNKLLPRGKSGLHDKA